MFSKFIKAAETSNKQSEIIRNPSASYNFKSNDHSHIHLIQLLKFCIFVDEISAYFLEFGID